MGNKIYLVKRLCSDYEQSYEAIVGMFLDEAEAEKLKILCEDELKRLKKLKKKGGHLVGPVPHSHVDPSVNMHMEERMSYEIEEQEFFKDIAEFMEIINKV